MVKEAKSVIVGHDIGTSKIVAIVAEVAPDGALNIIGLGTQPSRGLKKVVVVNIDATMTSIQRVLEEAELMADCRITEVYNGVAGSHIRSLNSSGVVAIKEKEVTQADIDRVVETAKAIAIPNDQQILHILPQEFIIDGQEDVREPVGMSGVRLEVKVHIVTGAVSAVENIVKCVRRCGLEVKDVMLEGVPRPRPSCSAGFAEIHPALVRPDTPVADRESIGGLTGVGVAYKLAQAGLDAPAGDERLTKYLDLVTLGTIADMGRITGENRVLVRAGLEILSSDAPSLRPGMAALKQVSGLRGKQVTVGTVGFTLAPRINASGRLEKADAAFRLMTTDSPEEALQLAALLDTVNRERQAVEESARPTPTRPTPSPSRGFSIYLDPQTAEWMDGSTIDYLTLDHGAGFQIDNPAATPSWEDPVCQMIQKVIDEKVTPVVGAHGGWVELDRVEGSTAYVRLGGGCQGCASASFTLSQGISSIITSEVEEIEHVVDETNHESGSEPYYSR